MASHSFCLLTTKAPVSMVKASTILALCVLAFLSNLASAWYGTVTFYSDVYFDGPTYPWASLRPSDATTSLVGTTGPRPSSGKVYPRKEASTASHASPSLPVKTARVIVATGPRMDTSTTRREIIPRTSRWTASTTQSRRSSSGSPARRSRTARTRLARGNKLIKSGLY
ncbi:hypothetical protein GQ600_23846 [Phytophthora cactorum]|nr:hypothetical protein GQ600_23846 [Phytophthora cactorum]